MRIFVLGAHENVRFVTSKRIINAMSIEHFSENSSENRESVICDGILDTMASLAENLRHQPPSRSLMPQIRIPTVGVVSWFPLGMVGRGMEVRVTQQHAEDAAMGVEIDCHFEFKHGQFCLADATAPFRISVPRTDDTREKDHFIVTQEGDGSFVVNPQKHADGTMPELPGEDLEAYAALPRAALDALSH